MKNNGSGILRPALILCAICFIVTLLLAVTNAATERPIAEAAASAQEESLRQVLPGCDSYETPPESSLLFWVGKSGGETKGYVFVTASKGYGGDISVMTGVDTEGKITGVQLLESNETPGLGQRAGEEGFRSQYTGKGGVLSVAKNSAGGEGEIGAITGATITSRAVTEAVNQALACYETVKGGEANG